MQKVQSAIGSVMERLVQQAWRDPAARVNMILGGQEVFLKNLQQEEAKKAQQQEKNSDSAQER